MADSVPRRLVEEVEEVLDRRRDRRIRFVDQNVVEEHVNVRLQNVFRRDEPLEVQI